jgi:pyruvate dehydrogenase E1 component
MYRFNQSQMKDAKAKAQLFGSGAILTEVIKAQGLLEKYGVAADVWSVTSYKELYKDAITVERWNMLHPNEKPRLPYITQQLAKTEGVMVAASDYIKSLALQVAKWFPRELHVLGTDGFGRSESRERLREFFEVDARFVALATLTELAKEKKIDAKIVAQAIKDFGIDPEKKDPLVS